MGIEVTDERLFNAERDQLRARVAELEAALSLSHKANADLMAMAFEQARAAEAAEAERDRLRADLRQVKDDLTKAWRRESAAKRGENVLVDAFDKMIDAARAATGAGQ